MRSARRIATGIVALGWVPTLAFVGLHWTGETHAQERTPIKVTRIYTGPDNQTHAEEYDVPLGAPRGAHQPGADATFEQRPGHLGGAAASGVEQAASGIFVASLGL